MEEFPDIIYHIVSSPEYFNNVIGSMYVPESIIRNGFIHCTSGKETTLLAAEDYFRNCLSPIFILRIISEAILAPVRFECASPMPVAGIKYLEAETIFPHIYGSLNLDAVEGVGEIFRTARGFHWPDKFESLNS